MAYEIITFGGGDVLNGVFNALAMCLNAKTGTLYIPLLRIGMTVGAAWGVMIMAFRNQSQILSGMIIPLFAMNALMFSPSTTVWIIDPILKVHHKVDHVPLGIAAFSSHLSQISKVLTEQVEKIFSLPDDLKYQKTGTLFASNIIEKSKTFRITNEDIGENMKEFVCQCVMMDAMLGRKYTIEDLRKSTDLWKLISENPSPIRSILWKDPISKATSIMTCKEAVQKFNGIFGNLLDQTAETFGRRIFGNREEINAKTEFLQYLPVSFGYFLKSTQGSQDILKQQMMMHAIVEGVESKSTILGNAPNLAARRAYLQQKMTYDTIGEMVLDFLPVIKGVLEAVCYGAFIFLLPLAMMPQGYRFVLNWIQILVWLHMWPPLYAILNHVMNVSLQSKTLSLCHEGMTIASSSGIYQLHSDMASMAGYLSLSIPFLCIGLVKGVGSFIHMASSLTGVAQGSASSMACETLAGNYSVGNINEGNIQIANKNVGMVNTQSSYKSGAFQKSSGRVDMITSADGSQILNVATSNVPVSFNAASVQSDHLTEQASESYQVAFSKGESAAQNLSDCYRHLVELSKHQSQTENVGHNYSINTQNSDNKSMTKAANMIESFAKNHDMSVTQASHVIAQASIGGSIFGVSGALSAGIQGDAKQSKMFIEAENLSKSEEFQNSISESIQYSKSHHFNQGNENGKRIEDQFLGSYEKSMHYRDEAAKNYRTSQDLQKQASYIKSHSSTINSNFTQQALDFISNSPSDNASGKIGMRTVAFWASHRPEILAHHMERYAINQGLIQKSSMLDEKDLQKNYESKSYVPSHNFDTSIQEINDLKEGHDIHLNFKNGESIKKEVEDYKKLSKDGRHNLNSYQDEKFKKMKNDIYIQKDTPLIQSAAREAGICGLNTIGSSFLNVENEIKKIIEKK